MLELHYTNQMKRDLRLAKRRGKDLKKLNTITNLLQAAKPLLEKHYKDHWECHIEPDWLHIYLVNSAAVTLVRTGTHSELF